MTVRESLTSSLNQVDMGMDDFFSVRVRRE